MIAYYETCATYGLMSSAYFRTVSRRMDFYEWEGVDEWAEELLITYYETCATYGLNVERVFQDGE